MAEIAALTHYLEPFISVCVAFVVFSFVWCFIS